MNEPSSTSKPDAALTGRAKATRALKPVLRIVFITALLYTAFAALVYFRQRSILFFPTHDTDPSTLQPWTENGLTIGFSREAPSPETVWLMMHGNAGQAAHRAYVLDCLSSRDSLYVLEYPGYGRREGNPCLDSINRAASEAYQLLRAKFPGTPVCVIGESIGSGPACALGREKVPPGKIALLVPFDSLVNVGRKQFPFLPVRLMLRDAWDNREALQGYPGPVDIYGALNDTVIPIGHARALAHGVPQARLIEIAGGHNEWAGQEKVKIRRSSGTE